MKIPYSKNSCNAVIQGRKTIHIYNFKSSKFIIIAFNANQCQFIMCVHPVPGPWPGGGGGVRYIRTNCPKEIKVHYFTIKSPPFKIKGPLFIIKVQFYIEGSLVSYYLPLDYLYTISPSHSFTEFMQWNRLWVLEL